MMDLPPANSSYACPVSETQAIACDVILKRLAEDEALIEVLQTQDKVDKNIRAEYNDLMVKYLMLLRMYERLQQQIPEPLPEA